MIGFKIGKGLLGIPVKDDIYEVTLVHITRSHDSAESADSWLLLELSVNPKLYSVTIVH